MRKTTFIILAALAAAVGGGGTARAESIYNLNLAGLRLEAGDARATALGGSMQLLDDSLAVLQTNPAMLTYFRKVTFGVSQYVSSDLNRSGSLNEQEVATKFTSFAFAFPLSDRFTVALGFRGRFDPDGGFTEHLTSSAGETYRQEFIRKGGLNSYPISVATGVSRYLQVGAYYSIENGSIENRWNIIFDAADQRPAFSIQKRTMSGHGWGVGAVVRPVRQVLLGLTYEGEIDYDTSVREFFSNSRADSNYDESTVLPARWTAAAQWHSTNFALYAGGSISDFEQFEGLEFPKDRLYREETASVGFEYLRGFPLFGTRFPVRLSFVYARLPYSYPDGERVQQILAGLGTGLKFRNGRGKLDLALQTGKVGSRDTNGFETRVLRLYVAVSGAEIWKRAREDAY